MTSRKIEFYRHSLKNEDIQEAIEVLQSVFLTTGPVTRRFEEKLAQYLGRRHAIGVSSCTAALFLSLKAMGIKAGEEVITTPMTFIASANVILHAGAIPVFVDVEPTTGNLDLDQLESAITSGTRAVIPVHLYGQMVDMQRLFDICQPRGIKIIEDAAHALEARRDGIGPGQLGDTGCFSFYATKNMTSGEGGAIVTDDPHLDTCLRRLRNHGMSRSAADRYTKHYSHWDMVDLGYKANLTDIQSALLIHQIDRLETQLKHRNRVADRYIRGLSDIPGLEIPQILPNARSARHLFTIWVPEGHRDQTLSALQSANIGVAVNFRAIHLLSFFRRQFGYQPGAFPVAERIGNRTISLPFYPSLNDDSIDLVIASIHKVAKSWG